MQMPLLPKHLSCTMLAVLFLSVGAPRLAYASELAKDDVVELARAHPREELPPAPYRSAQRRSSWLVNTSKLLLNACLISLVSAASNGSTAVTCQASPALQRAALDSMPRPGDTLYSSELGANQELWTKYKKEFDKAYDEPQDDEAHFANFLHGLQTIDRLNAEEEDAGGERSYGLNPLTDVNPKDLNGTYFGARIPEELFAGHEQPLRDIDASQLQSRMWTDRLTPIKNQGACGGCWAFAAIESLESHIFQSTGKLPILSAQQLVSCDRGSHGCGGGWTDKAFAYMKAHGAQLEETYPYASAGDGHTRDCAYNSSKVQAVVTGYGTIGSPCHGSCEKKELNVMDHVSKHGPVAVYINANTLQYYRGGILGGANCDNRPSAINHAVQLVGWGVESNGQRYWLMRNSWGTWWGEGGFARIAAGSNVCGLMNYVYYVDDSYFGPDAPQYLSVASHAARAGSFILLLAIGNSLWQLSLR